MKIDSSQMKLSSSHSYLEEKKELEALHVWKDNESKNPSSLFDQIDISASSFRAYEHSEMVVDQTDTHYLDELEGTGYLSSEDKLKISVFQDMLYILTGKRFKFNIPHLKLKQHKGNYDAKGHVEGEQQKQGWGMIYQHQREYKEEETMDFKAEGIVKTADGKEININIEMHMQHSYYEAHQTTIRAGDALIDPLILNFEGNAAQLSQKKFEFDLDFDGDPEQISYVGSGSGFLALDLNDNNQIDAGNELFGPETGHGFSELAQYDVDQNGWIDESDPIFNQLRIWMIHEDGTDELVGLGEKGVGAIYLGHTNSLFQLKDSTNELHGQIRESGIFLNEDGSVGTVQEIDFKV